MSLGNGLARVIARDARYSMQAYVFLFEALEYARARKLRGRRRARSKRGPRADSQVQHVTGQELCEGARRLALEQYGMLAPYLLAEWGVVSTSDFGEIVYNLIAAGDMEKTPSDKRSDFDHVFDFATGFLPSYVELSAEADTESTARDET